MTEWWRKLPHPTYGRYGGALNQGPGAPIDNMDAFFKKHDVLLTNAKTHLDFEKKRLDADCTLYHDLKTITYTDLKHPIYGTIYRRFTLVIFWIVIAKSK